MRTQNRGPVQILAAHQFQTSPIKLVGGNGLLRSIWIAEAQGEEDSTASRD